MQERKGRPFLEVFASALHEDYRFPILELFAFLYALGTFVFASFVSVSAAGELIAYSLTASLMIFPLFTFIILIFKNVAYGFGSDIEKGIIQTFLSYPLKRRWVLSAKLLSALGVALLLFLSIQISAMYVLAPDVVGPYLGTVILTYVANLSYPLLLSAIILFLTLILRRGSIALVVGIVLYFALGIVSSLASFIAFATQSPLALQVISVFSPNVVLGMYYQVFGVGPGFPSASIWTPSFTEALLYLGASYVIVAAVFATAYIYFSRRFSL